MIVDIIKTIVESMSAVGGNAWIFFDAELYELNYSDGSEVAAQPFGFLIHPVLVRDKVNNLDGSLESTASLELYLLQSSKLADTQQQRNPTLATMYDAKAEFIKRLLMNDGVQQITASDSEEVYNVFDNNFDGLLLHVSAKLEPEIFCIPVTP